MEAARPKRLAIVIPYRDREAHLAELLPALTGYLARTVMAAGTECTIHVVEQLGADWFNRGKLLNCGFSLAMQDADYFVFHDVDYVPVSADYGWVSGPTRLIWHGLVLRENYDYFFGAVTAFRKDDFLAINGYSNDYWGWGCEDVDVRFRCECRGLAFAKRDGTFRALAHAHNGFVAPGVRSPQALATHAVLDQRLPRFQEHFVREGLSTLKMSVRWTKAIEVPGAGEGERRPRVLHHGVDLLKG